MPAVDFLGFIHTGSLHTYLAGFKLRVPVPGTSTLLRAICFADITISAIQNLSNAFDPIVSAICWPAHNAVKWHDFK